MFVSFERNIDSAHSKKGYRQTRLQTAAPYRVEQVTYAVLRDGRRRDMEIFILPFRPAVLGFHRRSNCDNEFPHSSTVGTQDGSCSWSY